MFLADQFSGPMDLKSEVARRNGANFTHMVASAKVSTKNASSDERYRVMEACFIYILKY